MFWQSGTAKPLIKKTMLYTRIRFGLIILFLGLGFLLHIKTGLANAWFLYAAGLLLLITYFLFGNVWVAFTLLRKGKVQAAEKVIRQIKWPQWLIKKNRAYYHFTKGMIHLQKKELKAGEEDLLKACELGLQRKNDKAMASLNLAHIYYVRKEFNSARQFLQQAASCQANDFLIKDNIKKLETILTKKR